MKKGIGLVLGLFTLVACNNTPKSATNSQEELSKEVQQVGGDKDDHGCLVGAGETWSTLKQTCLRLFEAGVRLDPISTEQSAVISAFVVYNDDQSKLELFVPEEEKTSFILDRKEENLYEDDTYKFDAKEGVLYIHGEKQYAK